MRSLLYVLPVTGLTALLLTGCQLQQPRNIQPVATKPYVAPAKTTVKTTAPKPIVDPINDPALRGNDSGGSGGGGGGGGGGSPGGGGGGSWG